MVAARGKVDLLVIVGPTASGKSALAMKLAEEFNGEIIAADSRTIYKGMDIGTAKPSIEDRTKIKHWGLDLVEPGQLYSAAKFKKYALEKIADIQSRGRLPILVGGTGLYIDGVIFDFEFIKGHHRRTELNHQSVADLQAIIKQAGYSPPENSQNKRHLIRTIERQGNLGTKNQLRQGTLLIGLLPSDELLKQRISSRGEAMYKKGIVSETQMLLNKYGESSLSSTAGIIYKICIRLINGEIDKDAAKELFKIADWQYARRQKTWFKRNKFIQWFENPESAYTSVIKALNN
jgi:tRNA dimethylallyltransferase